MYNNCKALRAGLYSYYHLNLPALYGPPGARPRTNKPGPAGGGAGGGAGSAGSGASASPSNGKGAQAGQEAPAVDGGSGEPRVLGTTSDHAEGAIINLVVALTS
jgi:hypothetical protein